MKQKKEFISDLRGIQKELNEGNNKIIQQNKKVVEIEDKLSTIDEKMKISEKYVNGFSSFWGFFPNLFSFLKSNKTEKQSTGEIQINNNKPEQVSHSHANANEDDLLMEINELNIAAKKLKNEVNKSCTGIEHLDNHFDKTHDKLEKISSIANKVKESYK